LRKELEMKQTLGELYDSLTSAIARFSTSSAQLVERAMHGLQAARTMAVETMKSMWTRN